jgi:hypothetical protein
LHAMLVFYAPWIKFKVSNSASFLMRPILKAQMQSRSPDSVWLRWYRAGIATSATS